LVCWWPWQMSAVSRMIASTAVAVMVTSASAQVLPSAQRAALVDLYDATGGAMWGNSSGWLQGDPCSANWHGVSCYGNSTVGLSVGWVQDEPACEQPQPLQ
jgi:hypothetical protein